MSESFDDLVSVERHRLMGVFQRLGADCLIDAAATAAVQRCQFDAMNSSMVYAAAIYNSTRRGTDYSERLPLRIVEELNAAEASILRLSAEVDRLRRTPRLNRPWWEVLGVSPAATEAGILSAFRRQAKGLAKASHPHPGGSSAAWRELITARELALASEARRRFESEPGGEK